jgi:hypothetical protein
MNRFTRRDFVTDVARGMIAASVGSSLAGELLPGTALADGPEALSFGRLEPLVALMQETPANRLMPLLAERLRQGTELRDLLAAGALANARTFGGEDYVGFHTMMALAPAWQMSRELPDARRALPVLKVLHRNTTRIQETGGRRSEVLHPVQAATLPAGQNPAETLRDQVRRRAVDDAERTFAAMCRGRMEDAFNELLLEVQDATEVHRVVLPYRAWDLMEIIGRDQAHTLLRQSVRYCVKAETPQYIQSVGGARTIVPRLLDQYHLVEREPGTRAAEDAWVDRMCMTLLRATPDAAADAVAAALAEGIVPAAVGEAICLAANQLVLRDPGRTARQAQPNKPVGSVHGDSIGVHASDSANAWRNMARVGNRRNGVVCLILGAYQLALDSSRQREVASREPLPTAQGREAIRAREPAALLRELDAAVRAGDQARAAAVAAVYGEANHAPRPIFDLLLGHAIRDEGALHGEKYYRTTTGEFAATRPAFRWRHVVSLARVVASAAGRPDPGHAEAARSLGT